MFLNCKQYFLKQKTIMMLIVRFFNNIKKISQYFIFYLRKIKINKCDKIILEMY